MPTFRIWYLAEIEDCDEVEAATEDEAIESFYPHNGELVAVTDIRELE